MMTVADVAALIQDKPADLPMRFHGLAGDLTADEWWSDEARDPGVHICLVPDGYQEPPQTQQRILVDAHIQGRERGLLEALKITTGQHSSPKG